MQTTKIAWAGETWNPVTGCTKIGSGCQHCYAEVMAKRQMGQWRGRKFSDVQCHPERLDQPLKRKKPTVIFCCSMSDLWHEKVPAEFLAKVISVMGYRAKWHTYVALTKRPEWMKYSLRGVTVHPNVYLGVSVSTQADVDRDLPYLAELAKAGWKTIVSVEPLLEAVKLGEHMDYLTGVIVGCESGAMRRPCKMQWVRQVVKQCDSAMVPCFVKQLSMSGKVVSDGERVWALDFPRRLPWDERGA